MPSAPCIFARNGLARLCTNSLRDAGGPITTDEIALQVIDIEFYSTRYSTSYAL